MHPRSLPRNDIHATFRLRRFLGLIALAGLMAALPARPAAAATFTQLTTHADRDRHPTWTADGQHLIFESNRNGVWRLYRVPAAGGSEVQLTFGPEDDMHPSVSPDGTTLVFVRGEASASSGSMTESKIVTMPVGGGAVTTLTNSGQVDWYPAWSPDGQTIYFSRSYDGEWRTLSVPAAGGSAVEINLGAGQATQAILSPDNLRIAFGSKLTSSGPIELSEALLSNSSMPTFRTSFGANSVPNDYSPDGQKVLFASRKDGGWVEIYEYDLAMQAATRLTHDALSENIDPLSNFPSYSPDGTRVAFSSRRVAGNENIWIRDEDGNPPPSEYIVDVGDGVALPGATGIRIPVDLQSTTALSGLELRISDIPERLTVTGVETAGRAAGHTASFTDGGAAHILVYRTDGGLIAAGAGTVLHLVVSVTGMVALGDSIDLTPTVAILSPPSGAPPAVELRSGRLEIRRVPGDINSDSHVDVGDVVRLVGIVLGTVMATPDELAEADCNDDMLFDIQDVTCEIQLVLASSAPGLLGPAAAAPGVASGGSSGRPPGVSPGVSTGVAGATPAPSGEALLVTAAEPVFGFQLLTDGDVAPELDGTPGALQVSTAVRRDGRGILLAFDPQGGTWPAGGSLLVRADSPVREVRAYGAGGRPLVVTRDGNSVTLGEVAAAPAVQPAVGLPNPFRGATRLRFQLSRAGRVEVTVFDVSGRRVAAVDGGLREAGPQELEWNGRGLSGQPLPAGLYFARIASADRQELVRLVNLGDQ